MQLFIKNMVCNRCILVVQQTVDQLGIGCEEISLGELLTKDELSEDQISELAEQLNSLGFELLIDSKQKLIEKIKNIIIQQIHYSDQEQQYNYSVVLSKALHKDYSYISSLFSEMEETTIEKYIIHQKIERAKELILYDQLSLSEIAFELGYSSASHLSNQFKKITGLTPTRFKAAGQRTRKPLDMV